MQWNKVKHILIFVLLAVDLFLAINFGWKYIVDYSRTQQNQENIIALLAERGVTVSQEFDLPNQLSLPTLDIDFTREQEDAFSLALLGQGATQTELEDGTISYSSALGLIVWDSTGALSAALTPSNYSQPTSATDARTAARAMLESANISADFVWQDESADSITVSFDTAGVAVFNRSFTVQFYADHMTIQGWWTFDTPYTTHNNNSVQMMPTDAVFAFVELAEVEELQSIQAGYLLTLSSLSQLQLVPVWQILADDAVFYLDAYKYVLIET